MQFEARIQAHRSRCSLATAGLAGRLWVEFSRGLRTSLARSAAGGGQAGRLARLALAAAAPPARPGVILLGRGRRRVGGAVARHRATSASASTSRRYTGGPSGMRRHWMICRLSSAAISRTCCSECSSWTDPVSRSTSLRSRSGVGRRSSADTPSRRSQSCSQAWAASPTARLGSGWPAPGRSSKAPRCDASSICWSIHEVKLRLTGLRSVIACPAFHGTPAPPGLSGGSAMVNDDRRRCRLDGRGGLHRRGGRCAGGGGVVGRLGLVEVAVAVQHAVPARPLP